MYSWIHGPHEGTYRVTLVFREVLLSRPEKSEVGVDYDSEGEIQGVNTCTD